MSPPFDAVTTGRLAALAVKHGLEPDAVHRLRALLALLAEDPQAPTAVREPAKAVDVHVADALSALALAEVELASRGADMGSGAGIPGLVLAAARPGLRMVLVESVGRKAAFLRRAAAAMGKLEVEIVVARAEEWRAGRDANDLVCARALAPLPVVAEYAAPLLAMGGVLVAWRGRRDSAEERAGARAAQELGLEQVEVRRVEPFANARNHHLHVLRKVAPTSPGFPRRPGMARKRPLGAA